MRQEKVKERVYDDIYGRKNVFYERPHGLIAFLYGKLKKFEVNRYQAVCNMLPSHGERLLDVGYGDGDFILMIKNKFKECYGIDVSPLRIGTAKNRFKEESNIRFVQCDVDEGLPFNDSFFDAITCIAVLEHVLLVYHTNSCRITFGEWGFR